MMGSQATPGVIRCCSARTCGLFKAYIPAVKEGGRVLRYQVPERCPRRAALIERGAA